MSNNESEILIENFAKVLEDIEIDDKDMQQSINDIKILSNELKNKEINLESNK